MFEVFQVTQRALSNFLGWDASSLRDTQYNQSQDTQHEVTGNITTPPRWDASPSLDSQHEVTLGV